MEKEQKNKVGRPRLADSKIKKHALIFSLSCIALILFLLAGALVSLNILPKFSKTKGEVLCSSIPDYLAYDAETNPNGFKDINFYSAVIMGADYIPDDDATVSARYGADYCNTITPEQLSKIVRLSKNESIIESTNGIQYLTGLEYLSLVNDQLTTIDLSYNENLIYLDLAGNKLEEITLPSVTTWTGTLNLSGNNLSGELDLSNINFDLGSSGIDLSCNNFTSVKFGTIGRPDRRVDHVYLNNNNLTNISFNYMNAHNFDISNNNLESISNLENAKIAEFFAYNNKLESINLSNLYTDCRASSGGFVCYNSSITIDHNPVSNTKYLLKGNEVEYNPITLNNNFPITTEISNESVISLSNNILKGLQTGTSIIKMKNENIDSYDGERYYYCIIYAYEDESCQEYTEDKLDYFFSQEIKVYDVTSDKYSINKDKKEIDVKNNTFDKNNVVLTLNGLTGEVSGNNYVIKDGNTIVDTYKLINVKTGDNNTSNNVTTTVAPTTTKKRVYKKTTTIKSNNDVYLNGDTISKEVLESIKGTDKNIVLDNRYFKVIINGKDINNTSDIDLSYVIKSLDESSLKDKVKLRDGIVIEFKNNNNVPKMKLELNVTSDILKHIGKNNISIYRYNNGLIKIADKLKVENNKLTFTIDKLNTYVITNKEVVNKVVEDTKLIKENSNKTYYVFIVIPILLLLIIIGYVAYKRNNES